MVLALAAGLLLGGVPVNTVRMAVPPDVAPCTVDEFARGFRARLGQLAVVPGVRELAPDQSGELQVAVRRAGKGLELRVRAPALPELVREIPGPGTDCLAASETAALIVERYLDEVAGATEPAAASSLTPIPPPPPPVPWGIAIEAALTGELWVLPQPDPGESTSIPVLGVGGFAAIGVRHGRWQLSARGTLEPAGSTTINGSAATGSLHLQAGAIAVALGYHLPTAFGAVRFELAPGLQLFSASTSSPNAGQFGKPGSSFGFFPFIGVDVGYELPLWKQLSALAQVGMRVHLGTATFEFGGISTDEVYTRQVDGEAAVGLGYVFY